MTRLCCRLPHVDVVGTAALLQAWRPLRSAYSRPSESRNLLLHHFWEKEIRPDHYLLQSELTSSGPKPQEFEKGAIHSFCKTLTALDTSTHGGFFVLRMHAEECLPLLDMSQNPPCQAGC